MKPIFTLRSFVLSYTIAVLLGAPIAQAATYYWDTDGAGTPGFGTASGTWGSSAFWGTDAAGSSATANTTITTADTINFGTGTVGGGLAAGTVGVNGTVSVNKITFGSLSGAILLSGGTQITMGGTTPTITVNNAQDTISTSIVNTTTGNNSGLTKSGTGELIFSGTGNSIAGDATSGGNGVGIRLSAGTLTVSGGSLVTATAGKGIGTFSGDAGNFNQTGGTVTVNATGDLIVGWNSASTFTLSGGTTSAANIRHQDAGDGVITISGTNTTTVGNVTHTTAGGGTDSLTVNLNTGGTLEANTLQMTLTGTATTAGNHSLNVNFDGGMLKARSTSNLIAATPTATSTRSVNVVVKSGGALINTNGFTSTILQALQHDTTLGATLDGGLTKSGAGTLILSGTSTYTGATNVNAGILQAGAAAGGQAFGIGSAVTLANTSGVSLNLNNFNQSIGSLAGGGVTGGNVSLGANATLTTGGNNSSTSYAGVIGGTGTSGLTKAGNGVLTLTNTSTYTGATLVSGGTLAVNGSLANTSSVTVQTGATLQGSGSISSLVTIQGNGTLASGNSIESLGTGALTFDANSTLVYEMNNNAAAGVAGDLTYATGNLTLALTNNSILTLSELGAGSWSNGDKLTLISYTGSWNGGLFDYLGTDVTDDSQITFSGSIWLFNYNDTVEGTNYTTDSIGNFVTMTVIPEPSSALLSAIGLLFLLRRRR